MRNLDADRPGDMPLLQLANATGNAGLTFPEESIDLRRSSPMSSEALSKPILRVQNLKLVTPDKKRTLLENLSLEFGGGPKLIDCRQLWRWEEFFAPRNCRIMDGG
jgi:hypothetical protein